MKQAIILVGLFSIVLNGCSQSRLVNKDGNLVLDTAYTKTLNLQFLAPLSKAKTDTVVTIGIALSNQFSVVNGVLYINSTTSGGTPTPIPAIDHSDWYQEYTSAVGQTVFPFRNLPPNYQGFLIVKNGVKILRPVVDYIQTGNTITIPLMEKGYIEYIRYY